jgi:hypothetical protein
MDSARRRIYGRPTMRSRSSGPEPAEPGVFISYRRLDAGGSAGRLHGDLSRHLGEGRVFRDREMRPGTNWVKRLQAVAGACHVMLVVIGPKWATLREDGAAAPRLADPSDTLRIEIETALARDEVTIIPVLVDDARMPEPGEVPPTLAELCEIQAYTMSDARWDDDLRLLERELDSILGTSEPGPSTTPPLEPVAHARGIVLAGALAAAVVAIGVSAALANKPVPVSAKHISDSTQATERIRDYALERGVLWGLAGAGLLLVWSLATAPGRSPLRPALDGLLAGAIGGALGGAAFQGLLYAGNANLVTHPLEISDDIERIPELVLPAVCIGWALARWAPSLTRVQGALAGLLAGLASAVVQMPMSDVFGKSGHRWEKLLLALGVVLVPLILAASARRERRAAPRLSVPAH